MPVTVILEQYQQTSGRWSIPQWRIRGMRTGEHADPGAGEPGREPAGDAGKTETSIYTMNVRLYRDAAEGYWYNLLSDSPYVFLVCAADSTDSSVAPKPMLATVSQDEALAHMESDDLVLSWPMTPEMIALVEKFVLDHYTPEVKRKRKRRQWAGSSVYERPPED